MKRQPEPVFPLYTVDAFAEAPFRGNPAGVCFLMGHKDAAWMQAIAREMNLSETAFFMKKGDHYHLRWFTPTTEVDLCGHATLATAHIIWETEMVGQEEPLRFETRSGILTARQENGWIVLDFPAQPPQPIEKPLSLLSTLGLTDCVYAGWNGSDCLIQLENARQVQGLKPDFHSLRKLPYRGVIVTADSPKSGTDFISRFFAPAVGVDEDPATGSAHCCLGPFWAKQKGKASLTGYQASKRGGIVKVEMVEERVLLKGKAVTVFQGVVSNPQERP